MEKFKDYKRLIGFIKPHRDLFFGSIVCKVIASVLEKIASIGVIIPFITILLAGSQIKMPEQTNLPHFISGVFYNLTAYLNSLGTLQLLYLLAISIPVLFLLKEIFAFLHSYLITKLSLQVVKDIRNKLYGKLLKLSLDFYSRSRAGQLVSKITYDAGIVQNAVAEGLRDLIYESIDLVVLLIFLVGIVIAFAIPWWLIFVMLIVMPAIAYPVTRIGKRLRSISTNAQKKMADVNSILYETFSGIRIVKAFDMTSYEEEKFKNENEQFYKIMLKSVKRLAAVSPLSEYIAVLAGTLVIFLGGKLVVTGELDPGAFTAFIACLLQMIKPFKKLSRVHGINQQALAAAERIFDILDQKPTIIEKERPVILPTFKDKIVFEEVSFKYEKDEVLKGLNLEVSKRDIIAIVGKSGVGKSTLVNLIPRFYDTTKGRLLIDGYDVRDLTLTSLRGQIGVVTQETILFNDTIRANISYGKKDASLNDIKRAARIANAQDFIEKLPEKYNTIIGDRGFKLSGGEKQRLAIARAILKNPPILILDEATSQLDTESERLVQSALDHLIEGRTVFVIAHRLSTIKHASRIIVLKDGRIAEVGSHTELMNKGGLYEKLYNLQFRDM